jgi:acyl dehydratase
MTEDSVPEDRAVSEADLPLVGDAERALIGTELARSSGRVSRREFQRWAAAVGDRNPLYFDVDYARAAGYADVIAPPLFVQYVTQGVMDLESLRVDGIPSSGGLPLARCPKRLAGGEELVVHAALFDGDEITAVRTVENLEEKYGRSGRFVLVTSKVTYRRGSEIVAENHSTMIARP